MRCWGVRQKRPVREQQNINTLLQGLNSAVLYAIYPSAKKDLANKNTPA